MDLFFGMMNKTAQPCIDTNNTVLAVLPYQLLLSFLLLKACLPFHPPHGSNHMMMAYPIAVLKPTISKSTFLLNHVTLRMRHE